ncbi:hypothetical protein CGMCC3_g8419 [Colletotrichum fructicola]|nr:uncharacterized protein CGMCC3_g8419 [Colletotrichum fructicola]KAE9575553.1 hypothetical protein CGMCC3_g8419 [Colletotrichum fructicola]
MGAGGDYMSSATSRLSRRDISQCPSLISTLALLPHLRPNNKVVTIDR